MTNISHGNFQLPDSRALGVGGEFIPNKQNGLFCDRAAHITHRSCTLISGQERGGWASFARPSSITGYGSEIEHMESIETGELMAIDTRARDTMYLLIRRRTRIDSSLVQLEFLRPLCRRKYAWEIHRLREDTALNRPRTPDT